MINTRGPSGRMVATALAVMLAVPGAIVGLPKLANLARSTYSSYVQPVVDGAKDVVADVTKVRADPFYHRITNEVAQLNALYASPDPQVQASAKDRASNFYFNENLGGSWRRNLVDNLSSRDSEILSACSRIGQIAGRKE
jgi:hypothetical protein